MSSKVAVVNDTYSTSLKNSASYFDDDKPVLYDPQFLNAFEEEVIYLYLSTASSSRAILVGSSSQFTTDLLQ